MPLVDVFDEAKEYRLVLEVPGAAKEGLEVRAGPAPGTISIRAQGREEPQSQNALRAERGVRSGAPVRYERVVPVGWDADADRAKTVIDNGLLTVTVPKRKARDEEKEKK